MYTDAPPPGADMVDSLLLHWRVRCVRRRAPLEATSGPDAADLCNAVAGQLAPAWLSPPPALGRALRRWSAGVTTPEAARASLTCLAEVVAEASGAFVSEVPPARLGPVLEEIAAEADALVSRQDARPSVPLPTSAPAWRDRHALERDVEMAVALAAVERRESALAVVQVDRGPRQSVRGPHRRGERDADPLSSAAGILRLLVGADALYRLGRDKLAVLVPGTGAKGVGALMLRVTCASPRARLSWGATSLGAGAGQGVADAGALVMLAEADLVLRRRDLAHARRALAQHRQRVGASVAAALLLLAGAVAGIGSLRPVSSGTPDVALPAGGGFLKPFTVPAPAGAGAAPVPAAAAPAPGPSAPAPAVPSPPAPQQVQTVAAVFPLPPSPVPPPPVPSSAPPPPPPPPPPGRSHGGGKPSAPPGQSVPAGGKGHGPTV